MKFLVIGGIEKTENGLWVHTDSSCIGSEQGRMGCGGYGVRYSD